MLYIIPTPIGNLHDMTERAKEALSSVDLILCEDTRTTGHLLSLLGLSKPKLVSYHKHNEQAMVPSVLTWLEEGKKVGLVSDAGTPSISDPGALLVHAVHEARLPVTALPGPNAAITALSLSGLICSKFQFVGFLPRQEKAYREFLQQEVAPYQGVTIAYESPERLLDSLQITQEMFPNWRLILIKELTKMHEKVWIGTAQFLFEELQQASLKGEWVVLFSPPIQEDLSLDQALREVDQLMNECGLSLKTAVHTLSLLRPISKNRLYRAAIERK